ncbi:hypothetical protein [Streptomyces sp. NPDC057386]|uniref:Serine/threonine protein kinase n=1 Tax=Streptomyces thermocoprophilus TaxID=78356 RepID=A0ABV5VAC9_9ACTN
MAMGGWGGHEGHEGQEGHEQYGGHGDRHAYGPQHGPSQDSGRPPWQTGEPQPPEWAYAETQAGVSWVTPPPQPPTTQPPTPRSPYPPPPPPAPDHRGRSRSLLAALAVTAVLGAGAGVGAWYLTRDDKPTTATAPPAATPTGTPIGTDTGKSTATGPATPSASPRTATPPPSPSTPPSGYRRTADPVGYTIDVPEGWTRRQIQGEKAPVVYWDSPDDGRQMQIFELSEPTPADSLDLAEHDPGYGFSAQPGYRALDRVSGPGWAELTYRYDDAGKGARRVIDHRFRAADGTLYAIRSAGPESLSLVRVRAPLTTALAAFCPQGARCER